MPANINPIYSLLGDVSSDSATAMTPVFTTAAADYTGATATHNKIVFTAHATNGGFVQRLRFKAMGSNVATVARIFLNNGSVNTTATNNSFYGEVTLPATTAIATAGTIEVDYPLNFALPPAFRIVVGLGTTVVAGWTCVPIAGEY